LISFAVVGIATEIGSDPTIRHGADLSFTPVMVQDASGAGWNGMGTLSDVARDFVEVELHHVGVGMRQRESRLTRRPRPQKRPGRSPRLARTGFQVRRRTRRARVR
jgi:hypothetical protein